VVVVVALLTVCVRFGDVLVRKLPSPLYTAVIVWLPTESVVVAPLVALPPVKLTAAPKLTSSILNWTVPVGVPAPGATAPTVAVKVIDCPNTEGFAAALRVVAVLALVTVWVRLGEMLALKLPSPPYTRESVWLATASVALVKVAWPAL